MAYKMTERLDRVEKDLQSLRMYLDELVESLGLEIGSLPVGARETHSSYLREVSVGLTAIDTRMLETDAAKKAALLHKQGLSYFEIALQICPGKNDPNHHCGRECATKLRKAAKSFLTN